jgi:hypothetical protein
VEIMPKTFAIAIAAAMVCAAAPALASQDCGADMQALAARREAAMKSINEMIVSARGKKLDPDAFCGRSRPLAAAEEAMIAYMQKNKDWCQIPDDALTQLKASHAKSVAFGAKACTVAAQLKKMKQQAAQAQQQAGGQPQEQPLPAGPL